MEKAGLVRSKRGRVCKNAGLVVSVEKPCKNAGLEVSMEKSCKNAGLVRRNREN